VLPRRHVLTGVLVCGRCGVGLKGTTVTSRQGTRVRLYECAPSSGGCGRTSIVANGAEDAVLDAVKASDPDMRLKRRLSAAAGALPRETLLALAKIAERRAQLSAVADLTDVGSALARLDAEERALREQVAPAQPHPVDPELDDPERRERRHRGELTEGEVLQSRDWIAAWVERVVVRPSLNPRAPQADRLDVVWRD
jgi:hypothetical protein